MKTSLFDMTDDELALQAREIYAEQLRRETLAQAPARAEQLARDVSAALGRQDGDPWQPGTGAFDAYPTGAVVSHPAGTYYRATAIASHEPGATGAPWVQIWPDGDGWTETPPALPETWSPVA